MLNTRDEKIKPLSFRKYGQNGLKMKKKKNYGQSFQFLDMSTLCFVEFWKIIPAFLKKKKEL